MNSGVNYVGIMVRNPKRRKSILRIYRRVSSNHVRIFAFTPGSINWTRKKITGLHYSNNKFQTKRFPFPSVIYNRCYGAEPQLLRRIENRIGKDKCFNHVSHFDKQFIYNTLCNTNLVKHLPMTVPFKEVNINELLNNYGNLYLKPVLGNRGRGVYRVSETDAGEVYISQHYFAPAVICRDLGSLKDEVNRLTKSKKYIVQQGISLRQIDNKNFDIRVLVQKDRTGEWGVTNMVSRIAYSGCFNTSVCETLTPSKKILEHLLPASQVQDQLDSLTQISLATATFLEHNGRCHLGELSVDFGLDNDGAWWIIEVNGNPQRSLYKGLNHYQDVYRNPMAYAEFLMFQSSNTERNN